MIIQSLILCVTVRILWENIIILVFTPHTAEAAQIVLDAPVKTVMIPINVTHTAIVTSDIHSRLRSPHLPCPDGMLACPSTNLRSTLSSLVSFFAGSYKSTFGFDQGPPLHDALTIAYVSQPELFKARRFRVDVELQGKYTSGETVVDIWHYTTCDDSWGSTGKNCLVTEEVQVRALTYRCVFLTKTMLLYRSPSFLNCCWIASLDVMQYLRSTYTVDSLQSNNAIC